MYIDCLSVGDTS